MHATAACCVNAIGEVGRLAQTAEAPAAIQLAQLGPIGMGLVVCLEGVAAHLAVAVHDQGARIGA